MASTLVELVLDEAAYMALLRQLSSVADNVQDAPSLGLIPQENLVSDFVLHALEPHLAHNGGLLHVERIEFVAGRGNVIIKYVHPDSAASDKTVAFVGSHLDVVPANPETWERDPFTLVVEGDKLYGRGTTDCLGHVALLTQLFIELAKTRVPLRSQVVCVLIAAEENMEIPGVGVDELMKSGRLDFIKNGPVIWLDVGDSQPCIGMAGGMIWSLKATGKLAHSGLPSAGVNAIELAMDALAKLQEFFYEEYKQHSQELVYGFPCPSSMKPARIESSPNDLNQIPPWATIVGDIRLTPFYDIDDTKTKLRAFIQQLNADLSVLEGLRGPSSSYHQPGRLELEFVGEVAEGIACSIDSLGYTALAKAVEAVMGEIKPFSVTGSLPLVRDLQRQGIDLCLLGFGRREVYHGDNEFCKLSDMVKGFRILARYILHTALCEST